MSASTNDRREIDKQLSFALYGAANRMIRMHKPLLEPLGLTFPQYLVMVELLGESPRTVGDLGTRVGMDTGTITPLLKRLEKSGYVTRRRDVQDERKVMVELTSAGLALQDGIAAVPGQIQSACQMTDEQADEIRQTLETMGRSANLTED